MATMVANGVSMEDAELLGMAHEIDSFEKWAGLKEMRRDLQNNAVAREAGQRVPQRPDDDWGYTARDKTGGGFMGRTWDGHPWFPGLYQGRTMDAISFVEMSLSNCQFVDACDH
jgi:hypothetical protein